MSKHTPGPWMIRAERYRFIHVYAHGGGIAHLDTIDGEGAANARLIAAAPDLLEALEMIMTSEDRGFGIDYIKGCARDAIAKAKGDQQ